MDFSCLPLAMMFTVRTANGMMAAVNPLLLIIQDHANHINWGSQFLNSIGCRDKFLCCLHLIVVANEASQSRDAGLTTTKF